MLASFKDAGLCALFAAVGLTVNLTWCTLAGHTPGFTDALASLGIPVNPRAFFLAGILIMSVIFTILPRKTREVDASLWPAVALLACMGTACFAIASSQSVFSPVILSIGGLLLFGIGYFWRTNANLFLHHCLLDVLPRRRTCARRIRRAFSACRTAGINRRLDAYSVRRAFSMRPPRRA